MVNTMLAAAAEQGPSIWFVCVLGVAVVFVGLICIIGIISIMNKIFASTKKSEPKKEAVPQVTPVAATEQKIENRQEIIAAVCAAVAEENGTDISAIRVISFKKI